MKVKIIESTSPQILEDAVNKFFEDTPAARANFVDIKYIPVFDEEYQGDCKVAGNSYYSVMIIYK